MSETVRIKGNLIKLDRIQNETLEEQCKRILNCKLDEFYDTYEEMLKGDYCDKYIILDNNIYEMRYDKEDNECEFFEGEFNEDGSIDFHVMYYNGGCDLTEALEEVYKKL